MSASKNRGNLWLYSFFESKPQLATFLMVIAVALILGVVVNHIIGLLS